MKKIQKALPLYFLCLLLFTATSSASAQEVFKNFDVSISIKQNSSLEVTETIVAKVENVDIKRGIIRSVPVEYRDNEGKSIELGFQVLSVKLDGSDIPWKATRAGNKVEVKIGDPDKLIPPGLHTFAIIYSAERFIGFFEDHDELYWNVTGDDFLFPVIEASCVVSLPGKPFGTGFNTIEWYVGKTGTKGDKSGAKLTTANGIITTRSLATGEGLTVVYTWPKGLVTPPPPPKNDDVKSQGMFGAATLALIAGWFMFAWKKWGKDPSRKATIPLFSPPKNASPAFLRYVRDMRLDQTAFTSSIIGLAVKGSLSIEEVEGTKTFFGTSKGHYVIHETNIEANNLEPEEEALMMQLFPGNTDTVELTQKNSDILSGAMRSLGRNLRKRNQTIFTRNTDKCIPGILIYAAGVAATFPFSGEYPLNTILAGTCGLLIIALGMRLSKAANSGGQNIKQLLGRIFPALVIGVIGSVALWGEKLSPHTFIMFVAAAAIISVMRPLMVTRTTEGSNLLSEIEGLKLYMDTAEKNRLEMFNPPEDTPELFEKLLPYALALDVAKTWGNRFEKILTEAQYKPEWYVGPSAYLFMSGAGFNNFSSDLSSQIGSGMAPKPAPGNSSGMGGGGSVGGGGGGGGASGW